MRIILFILRKEFIQIFRNKQMLPIIFVMPILQLLILVNAATFEIKKVNVHLIDRDQSTYSALLREKFSASSNFNIVNSSFSEKAGIEDLSKNKAGMVVIIPKDFEKDLRNNIKTKIQFLMNAEDSYSSGISYSYGNSIVSSFSESILSQALQGSQQQTTPTIDIEYSHWYNQDLDYKKYMASGILVVLITMIATFLTSMNIVREKEIGTIEQLNVTPIKKIQFIIGKLIPFLIIGLFELAFGLVIAIIAFDITILGNIFLLFGLAFVYLLVMLGIGLWISTVTETQQQAMFIAWFIMVIFILMGGLFTPISSMPDWAQTVTIFNPVAQFIEIMRRVLLKGSGFKDVTTQFSLLVAYAIFTLSVSIFRYKKVSD
jgi:ABC-2 type transport system permease protein